MLIKADMYAAGGGKKSVEDDLVYTTANTTQSVIVNELSNIESVIVYYPANASVQCSATKINNSTYVNGYHANNAADTLIDINGNTFTFKWQTAETFKYRAYGE